MSGQRDAAAERSAHVERFSQAFSLRHAAAVVERDGPVVEVSPGVWQLRAIVERDAEIERLRALLPAAWEAGRDAGAAWCNVRPSMIAAGNAIAALAPPPDLAETLKEGGR